MNSSAEANGSSADFAADYCLVQHLIYHTYTEECTPASLHCYCLSSHVFLKLSVCTVFIGYYD